MGVLNNEVSSLHMNAGDGETSYTNNSAPQKIGISKSWHVLEEALKDLINDDKIIVIPKCFKIADLGCSSGPNTLSVISRIIHNIQQLVISKSTSISPDHEFQVFLNDLAGNDFNNLFKLLPDFYKKLDRHQGTKCFVSGLPGSFYGRLFPTNTLNFVYSSFSLHWLSKVPEGLESNKENIHMSMTSTPEVFQAYKKQHRGDFSTFLSSRGAEMAPGGRMALTFVGRSVEDPSAKDECQHFAILATVLRDMVEQGMIKEADLHSFNIPIYPASKQEVEEMVRIEGSFNLDRLYEFMLPWDVHMEHDRAKVDKHTRGKLVSSFIRAYTEPILAAHFGSSIMDEVYERYGEKLGDHLSREEPFFFYIAICLSKR